MKRVSVYFSSLLLLPVLCQGQVKDTLSIFRTVKIAADIAGPAYYLYDKNLLKLEGFISVDLDTSRAVVAEAGYQEYKYSQYNYEYHSSGFYTRLGIDFNLLSPVVARGRYYAGIGIRYGLSIYNGETSSFEYGNYWGDTSGSVPGKTSAAHFLEASPGIRSELFRNFSIGWSVRLRVLIYGGAPKGKESINIPGYGNGTKNFSPGISYFIIWSIPYKKF